MTREHLQQLQDLFHAARERTPADRESLLAAADPYLPREVESLRAQPDNSILATPFPAPAQFQRRS